MLATSKWDVQIDDIVYIVTIDAAANNVFLTIVQCQKQKSYCPEFLGKWDLNFDLTCLPRNE